MNSFQEFITNEVKSFLWELGEELPEDIERRKRLLTMILPGIKYRLCEESDIFLAKMLTTYWPEFFYGDPLVEESDA